MFSVVFTCGGATREDGEYGVGSAASNTRHETKCGKHNENRVYSTSAHDMRMSNHGTRSGIVSMMSWQTYISFLRRHATTGTKAVVGKTMTAQAQNDFLGTVPNANPMASILARTDVTNPSTEDWVNVFGPSGYNVQPDNTRNRKLGRVHLPDVLKVTSNVYLIGCTVLTHALFPRSPVFKTRNKTRMSPTL